MKSEFTGNPNILQPISNSTVLAEISITKEKTSDYEVAYYKHNMEQQKAIHDIVCKYVLYHHM